MLTATIARVYVGTYSKYNSGSIAAEWLDLTDYADREDFYGACRKLHGDEHDPEFMFQDFEGLPEGMIGESHISGDAWDWMALDEDERDRIEACQRVAGDGYCETLLEWIDFAQDRCQGQYDSFRDFAWEMAELQFEQQVDSPIWRFFDIDAFARDLEIAGHRHDESGYVIDLSY
jgi:antirestriction protein